MVNFDTFAGIAIGGKVLYTIKLGDLKKCSSGLETSKDCAGYLKSVLLQGMKSWGEKCAKEGKKLVNVHVG